MKPGLILAVVLTFGCVTDAGVRTGQVGPETGVGVAGVEGGQGAGDEVKRVPVRYYWAQVSSRQTVIDVIDLTEAERAAAEEIYYKANETNSALYDEPYIKPDDQNCLKRFEIGKKFSILTTKGIFILPVVGFGAHVGAGETHWMVYLEGVPGVDPSVGGLAVYGGVFPEGAKLVAGRQSDLTGKGEAELARRVEELACHVEGIEQSVKDFCAALPPVDAWDVQVLRGRFHGGATMLVTLAIRWEETQIDYLSGFWALDDSLGLVATLMKPGIGIEHINLDYSVDVDADGTDEVILESSYYEGNYYMLLDWVDKEPEWMTLTGDGA